MAPNSQEDWFVETYEILKESARRALRKSAVDRDHTLQPTAIVHEAYLRLANQPNRHFPARSHFLACAARVVRSVLVDHARRWRDGKRPERLYVDAEVMGDGSPISAIEILDLDAAMKSLEAEHPRVAKVVELRFFGGLEITEISFTCEVSTRTIDQDWAFGRAYLLRAMAR